MCNIAHIGSVVLLCFVIPFKSKIFGVISVPSFTCKTLKTLWALQETTTMICIVKHHVLAAVGLISQTRCLILHGCGKFNVPVTLPNLEKLYSPASGTFTIVCFIKCMGQSRFLLKQCCS
ncbi:unnamed protein product [Natator depressus]